MSSSSSIAGYVGAFGVIAGIQLSKAWIPQETKFSKLKRALVTVIVSLIVILVGIVLPASLDAKTASYKNLDALITSTPGLEAFSIIKECDKKNYEEMILSLVARTSNKNRDEAGLIIGEVVRSTMRKYFAQASASSLKLYISNYINFLHYLIDNEPIEVCRIENPDVYGAPRTAHTLRAGSVSGTSDAIRMIVKDKSELTALEPEKDSAALQAFLSRFEQRHPKEWSDLMSPLMVTDPVIVKHLAEKYLLLYTEMLTNSDDDIGRIVRAMKSH